jgi:hypothetical protein
VKKTVYARSIFRHSIKPLIISLSILAIVITCIWNDGPAAIANSTGSEASKEVSKKVTTLKPSLAPMMMQSSSGQCLVASFTTPTHFTVDTAGGIEEAPIYVVSGDFNKDTHIDLATANTDTANISVLLGNGTGNFGTPTSFTAGVNPFALAVGDFNEDTNLDLAATNFGSGNISVLLGNGLGGFSGPTNFTVGTNPTGIAIGDFNEDNNLDLVVANFGLGNISLLLGNGAGSFGAATNFTVGTAPFSLVVGDFNGNADLDVAVANVGTNNVSILLGNGAGSFGAATNVGIGTGPFFITTGDVDNDVDVDLVTANQTSNNITVLLNNGSGTFTPTNFPVGANNPFSVVLADFNLDGDLDAATANTGSNNVSVLLGNGAGSFGGPALFNLAPGGVEPRSVAIGNFDGNNRPDLVTANAITDNVSILLNTCSPPTITAVNVTREQGAPVSNSIIANVNDAEDLENNLIVTVNGGASATVGGVTVSNIVVSNTGVVTANVVASCTAIIGNIDFTLRVTDSAGNFAEDTLTVTVTPDATPPVITCPANITVNNDPTLCSAVVNFNVTAIDTCTANPTIVANPPSGTAFPVGVTTVNATATDALGNSSSCSFTVTVNDVEAPTVSCPANINVNTDPGLCSAVINFTATASDNCPGATVSCTPASGSAFPVGTTSVTCSATDASGNVSASSCSFTVTVTDVTPPVITCPTNITVNNDTGLCSAVVNFNVTATDNCTPVNVVATPPSGSTFPVGTTTVNATATDPSGNTANCSFTVTVNDNQPPVITCPSNIVVNNTTGQCSAVVNFNVTATDNCTTVNVVSTPPSGSTFPVGTTTVNATATDTAGNTATCSFTVRVNDTQAPTVSCPKSIVVGNTPGQCSAVVNFTATANDNCPGATVSCTPATGSAFPVGTTSVSCTATDASGNTSPSCSFTVTVNDTQSPTVMCPSNIVVNNAPGMCSAVVNFNVTAGDNCPGFTLMVVPPSGSTFPVGTTTVNAMVTDASGNTASCSFTVRVNDNQPPAITCPSSVIGMSGIVTFADPSVTDNCPGATAICVPPSGSSFPIGITTVTCTATDGSGNTASCSFVVATFDICLQDDSQPLNKLLFRSTTGDYIFCCSDGSTYTGKGTVTKKGTSFTLVHNTPQRRIQAQATLGTVNKGNASLQVPPGILKCGIGDTNTTNNTCVCGSVN